MSAVFSLEQARRVFASDRFASGLCGVEIEALSDHYALCSLRLVEAHCNARNVAMGGCLFTLADFAAAVAANTDCLLAQTDLAWVSLSSNIHFLSPAPCGALLHASCSAVKCGRTTALYRTEIKSPDSGRLYAVAEATMFSLRS